MLLALPQVLSRAQVTSLRAALSQANWPAGSYSAGAQAREVKRNRQLPANEPMAQQCAAVVLGALELHPTLLSAALPQCVLPPLFNRYAQGDHYGSHVDSAIQRNLGLGTPVRTDLSITVFLSSPDEYEGGELVIDTLEGAHQVKLAAGDAVLYDATRLHRVQAVTAGERWAACTWVQSLVPQSAQREQLFELDATIQRLRTQLGDSAEILALVQHYHNLLRQWAQA